VNPVPRGEAAAAWPRWDPDRVASAVLACDGVVRLVATPTSSHPLGAAAECGPGAAAAGLAETAAAGLAETAETAAAGLAETAETAAAGLAETAETAAAGLAETAETAGLGRRRPGATATGLAEVATYLPRRRVAGVRVRPDGIVVQVDCRYGEPIAVLGDRVRAAVLAVAVGCPRVDVIIRDLVSPAAVGDGGREAAGLGSGSGATADGDAAAVGTCTSRGTRWAGPGQER
jgi:hypothetical protein